MYVYLHSFFHNFEIFLIKFLVSITACFDNCEFRQYKKWRTLLQIPNKFAVNARHCRNEMTSCQSNTWKAELTKSLPKFAQKYNVCVRAGRERGRVTLGLTGVWWRQTPIVGTDASRTYDARCSYRVYEHDLRFHPSHHITTLPGTIPLPAFERFPAFPAPTLTTTNFS